MPDRFQGYVASFPGPQEVKDLLAQALEALDAGWSFNKTIQVVWEGEQIHVFARVSERGTVEFGKDHGYLLSEKTTSELKAIPGLTLNTQEVWAEYSLQE